VNRLITYPYSGNLKTNVFFQLEIPLCCVDMDLRIGERRSPSVTRPLSHGEDYVYAEVLYDLHDIHGCTDEPTHVTGWDLDNHRADLLGGAKVSPFVSDTVALTIVVRREFRDELNRTPFIGFATAPLPISENQSRLVDPDLYVLSPRGRKCVRPLAVSVPEPNVCPFCGWGPIVCAACREVQWNCPKCTHDLVVLEEKHEGSGDKRFTTVGIPREGWIVDGIQWDGSDFVAGLNQSLITGRVLDWLVAVGAVPFMAFPCFVDVSGCDAVQLKRLAEARSKTPR
jgi:hypothetical protein